MKKWVASLVTLALSACVSSTCAQTFSATLGFANNFKPDNWTPIYARVVDPDGPRPATLEVRSARGKLGHDVVARITTSKSPTTYTLYAPIGYLDRVVLQLRDEKGRLIGDVDLTETIAATPAALGGPAIGVAGPGVDALRVASQLTAATGEYVAAGALVPPLLPDRAIGYADIDCLVLASTDLDAIEDDVQRAIIAWVRAGGILVVSPGATAPTRTDAPLVAVLPAKIGTPAKITFEGNELVGRQLTDSGGEHPSLAIRNLGLGQIALLAFDPSRLPAERASDRIALWRTLTSGQLPMSAEERLAGVYDPLVTQAVAEQQLPAITARSSWAGKLIAIGLFVGLLLGPGELICLAASRRHPRTWYTVVGLGLVCVCGVAWVMRRAAPSSPMAQQRLDIRVEVPDGLAAAVALTRQPDPSFETAWLTADRSDPTVQPASEVTLAQRSDRTDVAGVVSISASPAAFRAIRYSGETLHPTRINADVSKSLISNASESSWDRVAIVTRESVRVSEQSVPPGANSSLAQVPTIAADDRSTRRVETGIERLAAEPGWAAILLDRRLSERLVRLLEVEPATTIIATRDAGGTSFTLQVIR